MPGGNRWVSTPPARTHGTSPLGKQAPVLSAPLHAPYAYRGGAASAVRMCSEAYRLPRRRKAARSVGGR